MKQSAISLVAFVLFLVAGCKGTTEPTAPDGSFTIAFHVKSAKTGLPIQGASIALMRGGLVRAFTTDVNGLANFSGDTAGTYYFITMADGYNQANDSIIVSLGKSYDATANLTPNPLPNYNDSLIAGWRFSNSFVDFTGHGHDGTRHGCSFVADRFGNPSSALSFNGSSDYIAIADSPELNFGKTGNFTVMMWMNFTYPPNTGRNSYMISKGTNASGNFAGYDVWVNGYLETGLDVGTNYGVVTNYFSGTDYGNGYWHLLAFSVDHTDGLRWSIDGGAFSGSGSSGSPSKPSGNMDNSAPFLIGGSGAPGFYFKGKMDDIRIYHGTPPKSYMDSLYHEGGW